LLRVVRQVAQHRALVRRQFFEVQHLPAAARRCASSRRLLPLPVAPLTTRIAQARSGSSGQLFDDVPAPGLVAALRGARASQPISRRMWLKAPLRWPPRQQYTSGRQLARLVEQHVRLDVVARCSATTSAAPSFFAANGRHLLVQGADARALARRPAPGRLIAPGRRSSANSPGERASTRRCRG
jgi:hypothetical protein